MNVSVFGSAVESTENIGSSDALPCEPLTPQVFEVGDLKLDGELGASEPAKESFWDNPLGKKGPASNERDSSDQAETAVGNYVILDTVSEIFDLAILCIKKENVIGLSMEGLNSSGSGEPDWIQINIENCTFLFDVVMLREKVFEEGLKEIIEDRNIVKVVHDCRPMSRYLHHRQNLSLANVFDTQVSDIIVSKQRNLGQFPAKCNSLLVCLMEYLSLPVEVCSKDYMQFVMEDNRDDWHTRPVKGGVLEAAVFKVSYLRPLRLKMIEMMLSRFFDGCDVYLGLMRDASDNHAERYESQMHLLPSELQNLAYRAPNSRKHHKELQNREMTFLYKRDSCYFTKQECSSTFFKGGEETLHQMVKKKRKAALKTETNLPSLQTKSDENDNIYDEYYNDDDENELHNRSFESDYEYEMLMRDITEDVESKDDDKNDLVTDTDKNDLDGNIFDDKNEFCSKDLGVRTELSTDGNAEESGSADCVCSVENIDPKASKFSENSFETSVCVSEILAKMAISSSKKGDVQMVPAGHEKFFWKHRNPTGRYQYRGGTGRGMYSYSSRGGRPYNRRGYGFRGRFGRFNTVQHPRENSEPFDMQNNDQKCDDSKEISDTVNGQNTDRQDVTGSQRNNDHYKGLDKRDDANAGPRKPSKFADNVQKSALSLRLNTKGPPKGRLPKALMQKGK